MTEFFFNNTQFFMIFIFAIWIYISMLGYERDDTLLLYVQFFVLIPLVLMLLADAFLKGTVLGYGVGFSLLFSSIYFVLLGTLLAKKSRTEK